jgi:hypothetical protein
MKRKKIKIIRIAAILIVSQLVIGISVAGVFDDDFMKLQQEQFELDRQLRQEQFKLQQQLQQEQFKLQQQLRQQQFRLQQQQFTPDRQPMRETYNQTRQYYNSMKLQDQQFRFQQLQQDQFRLDRQLRDQQFRTQQQLRRQESYSRNLSSYSPSSIRYISTPSFDPMSNIRSQMRASEFRMNPPTNSLNRDFMKLQTQQFRAPQQIMRQTFSDQQRFSTSPNYMTSSLLRSSKRFETGIQYFNVNSALPALEQLRQYDNYWSNSSNKSSEFEAGNWANELRAGAREDIIEWSSDRIIGAIDQAFIAPILPKQVTTIRTWYDRLQTVNSRRQWIQGLSTPPSNPNEALNRLKPIAGFSGIVSPHTTLLIPLLKGYYSTIFDAFNYVDAKISTMSYTKNFSISWREKNINGIRTVTPIRNTYRNLDYSYISKNMISQPANYDVSAIGRYFSNTSPMTSSDINRYFGTSNNNFRYSSGLTNRISQPTFNNSFSEYSNYPIYQPKLNSSFSGYSNYPMYQQDFKNISISQPKFNDISYRDFINQNK